MLIFKEKERKGNKKTKEKPKEKHMSKIIKKLFSLFIIIISLALGGSYFQLGYGQVKVDKKLSTYKKVSGVRGALNSIGSDTLNNLMALWAESFKTKYPNVQIQIEGKGSSTAPPALIQGTAQLGPMSRMMKAKEIDSFEKKYGYKPVAIAIAIDALAVFVHKNNPIQSLSLRQVDSIFSITYKRGGQVHKKWGDIGKVAVGFQNRPFSIYGRNSASGTYAFFKKVALKKGDYNVSVKEQPGSSAVVQSIGKDLYGIGYSGIGYQTSGVKALTIAEKSKVKKDQAYPPTQKNCLNGKYPLARLLYIYINKPPTKKMDTLTLEFLKFVLSKEGQKIVVKDGYYPLPATQSSKALKSLSKSK